MGGGAPGTACLRGRIVREREWRPLATLPLAREKAELVGAMTETRLIEAESRPRNRAGSKACRRLVNRSALPLGTLDDVWPARACREVWSSGVSVDRALIVGPAQCVRLVLKRLRGAPLAV